MHLAALKKSDFDHFKFFFARSALRANPVLGQVCPARASCYAVIGVALGFVINPAANHAGIAFQIGIAHGFGFLRCVGVGKIDCANIAQCRRCSLSRVQGV